MADLADHVQLRQARPGRPQMHIDEEGDVDFGAVRGRVSPSLGYEGLFSVENFDLPGMGIAVPDDPVTWSVTWLRVRPLRTPVRILIRGLASSRPKSPPTGPALLAVRVRPPGRVAEERG